MQSRVRNVIDMICDETGISKDVVKDHEILVHDEFIGAGYGRPTEAGLTAMGIAAENEGIILDPIYTGKCMSAMLALIEAKRLGDSKDLVFLHTGGAPAIHAYAEFLL